MSIIQKVKSWNWNKLFLWAAALVAQAETVYPGLTEADVMQSIEDGTFWIGVVKVFVSLVLVRAAVLIKAKK